MNNNVRSRDSNIPDDITHEDILNAAKAYDVKALLMNSVTQLLMMLLLIDTDSHLKRL